MARRAFFRATRPQRPAVGGRRRHHRLDGCAQDREGDHRRFRLGRADRQHHRGALAGALQGHGLRERLSDRQPGSRQDAVAAEGRARNGGTSIISPRNAAGPATTNTGAISPSSSGSSLRRSGTSTMPRSIAAPRPSTIRITSPSSSTITAGGSAWPKASRNMTIWKSGLPQFPVITVPTITLEGDANGAPHPDPSAYAKKFSGKYAHRTDHGRHRPQSAAGSAAGLCRSGRRRRR